MIMPFNDFVHKYRLKNKESSNMKTQNIVSSLSLSDVDNYLSDGPFKSVAGIVNLHPTKGTHGFAYTNRNYFDAYGCSPLQKLSRFFIK